MFDEDAGNPPSPVVPRDGTDAGHSRWAAWCSPGVIGCAALLALPFVIVTFVVMLFAKNAPLAESVAMSALVGLLVVIAAALLLLRDAIGLRRKRDRVREFCLTRADIPDDAFLDAFPHIDRELLSATRAACAEFLEVPAVKIHPADSPLTDLGFDDFPAAFFHVLGRVRESKAIPPPVGTIESIAPARLTSMEELAVEIQRQIDSTPTTGTSAEGQGRS